MKWKYYLKIIDFKMFLTLTSISLFRSNSSTIAALPLYEAQIKADVLKISKINSI